MTARTDRRKEALTKNLCGRCYRKPRLPNLTTCYECHRKQNIKSLERYFLAISKGLCPKCKKEKTIGKKHCEVCLKKQKVFRLKYKMIVYNKYANGDMRCVKCGIDDIRVLDVDHIHGGGTEQRKTAGRGNQFYHYLIKAGLPDGYQLLCRNCNWLAHLENAT